MNANHDPEAARSTCCFPVQIAYNFYCHGRNSSLMEARLISSVLVLRPSRVPCVLLPSPRSILPATPLPSASPLSCRSARFLTLFPAFPRASSHLSRHLRDSDFTSRSRSFSINATEGVMQVAYTKNTIAYYLLYIAAVCGTYVIYTSRSRTWMHVNSPRNSHHK